MWNAFWIESVSTNEPLTIATPRTIARAVSTARSLRREQALERDRGHRWVTSRSASSTSDGLDEPSSRTTSPSARNRMRSAIGRGLRVVGDHDRRLAVALDRCAQDLEHLGRRRRVEVAGGLVGEEHRRAREERAGDRDALLLAARELRGPVRAPVGEPDLVEHALEPGRVDLLAGDPQRQRHVLLGGQHRQQVEELEDEADVRPAQLRQLVVGHRRDVVAGDLDGAVGRLVEAGEDVHERRLARARRAHDGDELALRDVERDAAERVDGGVARRRSGGRRCGPRRSPHGGRAARARPSARRWRSPSAELRTCGCLSFRIATTCLRSTASSASGRSTSARGSIPRRSRG